jgi:dTDP-4-dehydrorhamnose reductase
MERLLVVGATGGLGSKLMELGAGRFEMFGTYNRHAADGRNMVPMDACNRDGVLKAIKSAKPDCVIDTHALTNLDYCESHQEEAWNVNVNGSRNVADACREVGCKYIFLSTDNVFDGKKASYSEEDETNPINHYAKTKVEVERELASLDIDYVVARTAVVYGTGGMGKVGFVPWIIDKLKSGERIRVVTDQRNNPTLSDNLAGLLFGLYEKNATGIFHTTGMECMSRYDFARETAKAFGLDAALIDPIVSDELKQIAPRPKNLNMITEKVRRLTGKSPLSVAEGLAEFKRQLGS